jgi:hypothetical protein
VDTDKKTLVVHDGTTAGGNPVLSTAAGAVGTSNLAANAVTTGKIAAEAVGATELASNAVTTVKITDANITASKLSGAQSGSAPIYGARVWVNFNGTGTVAIRASGNVSSITDLGVGTYRANFTTSLPDSLYSVGLSSNNLVSNVSSANNIYSFTTSSFDWQHFESNSPADCSLMCAIVAR